MCNSLSVTTLESETFKKGKKKNNKIFNSHTVLIHVVN